MIQFLISFLSINAIISGIFIIISKNSVISVLFLISVFINISGYLVLIGINFIGISYLIIYIGAIIVLFLFVIIIINLQLSELNIINKEYIKNLPLNLIISIIFFSELLIILINNNINNINQFIIKINNILIFKLNNQNNLEILNILNNTEQINNYITLDIQFYNFSQIQSIGYSIYTFGAIWLILSSLILLLSIIGPIVLSSKK